MFYMMMMANSNIQKVTIHIATGVFCSLKCVYGFFYTFFKSKIIIKKNPSNNSHMCCVLCLIFFLYVVGLIQEILLSKMNFNQPIAD